MASFLLGRNAQAYYNFRGELIGDIGSPSDLTQGVQLWLADTDTVVAGNLTDVSLNLNSDFADATTRETAASGFSSQVPVLKNGEVQFEMRWLPQDSGAGPASFTSLLINAWLSDGRIAVVFLDQLKTANGHQGFASNFSVSMEKTEALRDVQRMSVTLTVADSAIWYVSQFT